MASSPTGFEPPSNEGGSVIKPPVPTPSTLSPYPSPSMEGVRLFHDVAKNATVTVEIPTARYKSTYLCPTCNILHRNKTIHLNFDGQGATIVSRRVLEMLQTVGLPRMAVESTVVNPPSTRIDLNKGRQPKIIREQTNRIVVHSVGR